MEIYFGEKLKTTAIEGIVGVIIARQKKEKARARSATHWFPYLLLPGGKTSE